MEILSPGMGSLCDSQFQKSPQIDMANFHSTKIRERDSSETSAVDRKRTYIDENCGSENFRGVIDSNTKLIRATEVDVFMYKRLRAARSPDFQLPEEREQKLAVEGHCFLIRNLKKVFLISLNMLLFYLIDLFFI